MVIVMPAALKLFARTSAMLKNTSEFKQSSRSFPLKLSKNRLDRLARTGENQLHVAQIRVGVQGMPRKFAANIDGDGLEQ